MALIYAMRRVPQAALRVGGAWLAGAVPPPASVSHFFTKLVLAAPASFFSVAWASHEALALAPASVSHFFMKLVLAAPASFFSVAWASQPATPLAIPLLAPLAAMPGASLCELANAEVES